MADLIDRQALGVGRCSPDILPAAYCAGWNGLLNLINAAPAVDAVEVVRCKDCLHWSSGENEAEKWEYCKFLNFDMGPYAFCIFGERREENAADNG